MSKLKLSPLELLYEDCKNAMEVEIEALRRNITPILWEDLRNKLKHKELIIIVIRGIVRKGKSTVGIAIQRQITKMIIELFGKKEIQELQDKLKLIFSDQIEWTNFVTKTDLTQVCVLCDEYSRMGEGSYNATTEAQLFGAYLEMFAVNYIHSIFITPSHSYDGHATIILDVITKDEETKTTHCKIFYKNKLEGKTICLGRVEIDVSEVIEEGYYKNYLKKKQGRLDLLNKHGVRDIRELIFSKLALETYEDLKALVRTKKMSPEIVNIVFGKIARQNKTILSIISETTITNRVRGLLNMKMAINKLYEDLEKAEAKMNTKKATEHKQDINILEQKFKEIIEEEKLKTKIYEEYKTIGE